MTNFYSALSELKAKLEAAASVEATADAPDVSTVEVAVPVKQKRAYNAKPFNSGLKTVKLSLDRDMMVHFREGENVRIEVVDGALTLKPTPTAAKPGHFVVATVSTEQSGRGTVRLNQYVLHRMVDKFGMDAVRDLVKPGQRVKVALGKYRTFIANEESTMSFTVTKA